MYTVNDRKDALFDIVYKSLGYLIDQLMVFEGIALFDYADHML